MTTIDDYADNFLAQQISQVTGVAQVTIGGESKPAIRIQVDPGKLAASGLTLEDIRGGLVTSTSDAAKGTLSTTKTSFTIAANDQLTLPEQYENVVLAYRNGAPIRVRDVGHAVLGPADRTVAAFENNVRGIQLLVYKQPGANVIDTVDQIKAELPRLTANIPPAMIVSTILDRTVTIRSSVHDVEFTLALTIVLVVLVILLFLRNFWATLIPAVTVPLALLGIMRRDVPAQLQPRQSVADGAHHRGRLRGRRCDRGGGEHLPPYRGGGRRRWRRRSRDRGRSDSRCCRSASRWSRSSSHCCSWAGSSADCFANSP